MSKMPQAIYQLLGWRWYHITHMQFRISYSLSNTCNTNLTLVTLHSQKVMNYYTLVCVCNIVIAKCNIVLISPHDMSTKVPKIIVLWFLTMQANRQREVRGIREI